MDNLRRIILIFSVSVFFTLAICGIVLSFRNIDKPGETIIDLEPNGNKYDGESEESEKDTESKETVNTPSSLVIVMGEDGVKNLYFVIKVENETDLSVLFLPEDSKISYKSNEEAEYLSVYELHQKSISTLLDAISGKYNLTVENYIVTDFAGFGNFVNYFSAGTEGVEFYYPVRHSFYLSGFKYDFTEDQNYYDGGEARGIIAFTRTSDESYTKPISDFYDGTEIQRVKMASCFIKAFISQKLVDGASDSTKTNYDYYLTTFFQKYAETNMTAEQIKNIPAIMLNCKGDNVKCIVNDLNKNQMYEVQIEEDEFKLDYTQGF